MRYYDLIGLAKPAVLAAPNYAALVEFLSLYEVGPLLDHFPVERARPPTADDLVFQVSPLGLLVEGYVALTRIISPLLEVLPGEQPPNPAEYAKRYVARRIFDTSPEAVDV